MNGSIRVWIAPVAGMLFVNSLVLAAEPVGLLISAEELVELRDTTGPLILDVRSRGEYQSGHVPGALWVDLNAWKLHSLSEGGLADRAYWAEQVGKLGITRDTSAVIHGGNPTDATRLWWTLKYLGVRHVGILDGGFDAWTDAGAPVSREDPQTHAVEFEPDFQQDRLATFEEVQSLLKAESATIIDTRSDAEYSGTGGPGQRKGHIPGAVHQEWTNFVTEGGRFKPVDEMKAILKERGLTPQTQAITHCQTGGRASLNAFAMELAGYGPVKNYYCGWSEWSEAKEAPVETP